MAIIIINCRYVRYTSYNVVENVGKRRYSYIISTNVYIMRIDTKGN